MNKIKMFVVEILKHLNLWDYRNESYSQEGEDLILKRYFEGQKEGFYIDVGAHHPFRFSNTYVFYKKGWRGINIDAMPGSMKLFNKYRNRDLNVECGVSDKNGVMKYYEFNESAINGFDKNISTKREKYTCYRIRKIVKVKIETLNHILSKHKLLLKQKIDFLTIDVEGFDFKVLKSIDLSKYSPKLILIENNGDDGKYVSNKKISKYLIKYKYYFYAKTSSTFFYEKK